MRDWCNHCGRHEAIDTRGQCASCLDDTARAIGRHNGLAEAIDPAVESAGRAAAAAGEPPEACPHKQGMARYWWFRGYFEAKG